MSKKPEFVPFVRRAMYFSKPGDLWSSITWIAAIPQGDDVVDWYMYSSELMFYCQAILADFKSAIFPILLPGFC